MARIALFLKTVSNRTETEWLGTIVAGTLPECGSQLQSEDAGDGPSRRHAELVVSSAPHSADSRHCSHAPA